MIYFHITQAIAGKFMVLLQFLVLIISLYLGENTGKQQITMEIIRAMKKFKTFKTWFKGVPGITFLHNN